MQISIIARVILSKEDKPWLLLTSKLQKVWNLPNLHLISIGRGFYHVLLSLDEENGRVRAQSSISSKPKILHLQNRDPNFNPSQQKSTNTQVWIRLYDLPWPY